MNYKKNEYSDDLFTNLTPIEKRDFITGLRSYVTDLVISESEMKCFKRSLETKNQIRRIIRLIKRAEKFQINIDDIKYAA